MLLMILNLLFDSLSHLIASSLNRILMSISIILRSALPAVKRWYSQNFFVIDFVVSSISLISARISFRFSTKLACLCDIHQPTAAISHANCAP